jgi:hypothetical protein
MKIIYNRNNFTVKVLPCPGVALHVEGPLVVSYDVVEHRQTQSDSQQLSPMCKVKSARILIAVCALFVEMARIDETFTPMEMKTILSILHEKYGLSQERTVTLSIVSAASCECCSSSPCPW